MAYSRDAFTRDQRNTTERLEGEPEGEPSGRYQRERLEIETRERLEREARDGQIDKRIDLQSYSLSRYRN